MRLALFFVLAMAFVSESVAADPFEKLIANRWVWEPEQAETCEQGHWYTVSADRNTIWVERAEEVEVRGTPTKRAKYQVLGYGDDYIAMFLEQETWRDADGNLVNWRLQFIDRGRFVWIRSDWQMGRSTKPNWPCKFVS